MRGRDPILDRQVRAEVQDGEPGAARGDGKGERTKLVSCTRWETDQNGAIRAGGTRRGLVRACEPPTDRVARRMLARHVDQTRGPRVSEGHERRQHIAT